VSVTGGHRRRPGEDMCAQLGLSPPWALMWSLLSWVISLLLSPCPSVEPCPIMICDHRDSDLAMVFSYLPSHQPPGLHMGVSPDLGFSPNAGATIFLFHVFIENYVCFCDCVCVLVSLSSECPHLWAAGGDCLVIVLQDMECPSKGSLCVSGNDFSDLSISFLALFPGLWFLSFFPKILKGTRVWA
jgi:hypothetical protein